MISGQIGVHGQHALFLVEKDSKSQFRGKRLVYWKRRHAQIYQQRPELKDVSYKDVKLNQILT